MRVPVVETAILVCALSFASTAKPVHALSIESILNAKPAIETASAELTEPKPQPEIKTEVEAATKEAPKPVEHTVAAGETLINIADHYQTTWTRLYDKNTAISNPDEITINEIIVIPLPDEQLTARPLPAAPTQTSAPARSAVAAKKATINTASAPRGTSAGNTYSRGYCTWYAKNRRPDLPNNLGNAITWVSRAAAQGLPTGSTPRPGAIGQQGGHVVYVEAVNANGTITISEMNYQGFNIISSRTAPASNFRYIY